MAFLTVPSLYSVRLDRGKLGSIEILKCLSGGKERLHGIPEKSTGKKKKKKRLTHTYTVIEDRIRREDRDLYLH